MVYNIQFEVASLIMLFILGFFALVKNKYRDNKFILFVGSLSFLGIDIILDILTSYGISYYDKFPLPFHLTANTIYLVMQCICPSIFVINVLFISTRSQSKIRKDVWVFLPTLLVIGLTLSSPWTNLIFFFENGVYTHGLFFPLIYANCFYYVIIAIVFAYLDYMHQKSTKSNFIINIITVIVAALVVCIQFIFPKELTCGFSVTIALVIIYISYQNPDKKIDFASGVLNYYALQESFKNKKYITKQKIICLTFVDYYEFMAEHSLIEGNELIRKFAEDINKIIITDSIYRINAKTSVILIRNNEDDILKQVIELIDNRLSSYKYVIDIVDNSFVKNPAELERIISFYSRKEIINKREKVVVISQEHINNYNRFKSIEATLKKSIQTNYIEINYQPIYETKEKRDTGLEALARMSIDSYGYISPLEFIGIAEDNGLINDLGMVILENVCRFIRDYKDKIPFRFVDINLCPLQFDDSTLVDRIEAITAKYSIDRSIIKFELTESAYMLSNENITSDIIKLTNLGYEFSLDDFGTGYSTIECFSSLPFKYIKIDKSLIDLASHDANSKIVLESFIVMLKKINKVVIAEGVENAGTATELTRLGVDYIQGFYYSKPLKIDDLLLYMASIEARKEKNRLEKKKANE